VPAKCRGNRTHLCVSGHLNRQAKPFRDESDELLQLCSQTRPGRVIVVNVRVKFLEKHVAQVHTCEFEEGAVVEVFALAKIPAKAVRRTSVLRLRDEVAERAGHKVHTEIKRVAGENLHCCKGLL